jgi:two-component system response regulator FlrC
MSFIRLAKDHFDSADIIETILLKRMFTVSPLPSSDEASTAGATLICSDTFIKKNGGREKLIEMARQIKARLIIVITEHADDFSMTTDLGGKLINVSMPDITISNPVMHYGYNMVASLIDADGHLATGSDASLNMLNLAKKVAATDVTVFVNGPTGTGKEVLSRFVHFHSARKDKPFVGINCAAIPENMLEAILFGHEKGSFTGASTANRGIFRAADGGTLLLDEISEMPLSLQAKLLRVLQEKTVTPLGSQQEIDVDVRVIATTNRAMQDEINHGRFREDLYYRLNVFPLHTLSIADRAEDIIPIATALLKRHHSDLTTIPWMDESAIKMLTEYHWPGNVRELENVLQRAMVLASNGMITSADIIIDTAIGQLALPQHTATQQHAAFAL